MVFWGSPGLGDLTIGFLVKNYIYFDIGIPLKDIMGSIYKETGSDRFDRFWKVWDDFGIILGFSL